MDKIRIYPNRDNCYEKELIRWEDSSMGKENENLLKSFGNYLFSTESGQLRVAKLLSQLRRVAESLGKDLSSANQEDMQRVIAGINRDSRYAEATKLDYRRGIKQFFRWYRAVYITLSSILNTCCTLICYGRIHNN